MDKEDGKIGALKKITLSLEAGRTPDHMDLTARSSVFDFIFGLGSGGLTPFEFELADKALGEEINLYLKREEIPQVFQHVILPPLDIPESVHSLYLKMKVMRVVPATQREVIRALADITSCNDHCCGH
jgi:hypothetical protein